MSYPPPEEQGELNARKAVGGGRKEEVPFPPPLRPFTLSFRAAEKKGKGGGGGEGEKVGACRGLGRTRGGEKSAEEEDASSCRTPLASSRAFEPSEPGGSNAAAAAALAADDRHRHRGKSDRGEEEERGLSPTSSLIGGAASHHPNRRRRSGVSALRQVPLQYFVEPKGSQEEGINRIVEKEKGKGKRTGNGDDESDISGLGREGVRRQEAEEVGYGEVCPPPADITRRPQSGGEEGEVIGVKGGDIRRQEDRRPRRVEWQSSSLELWLGEEGEVVTADESYTADCVAEGSEEKEEEESYKSSLVYRNSVRIMVRPDAAAAGAAVAGAAAAAHPPPFVRSSSEERNGGGDGAGSSNVPTVKRKESLGVMQRTVVKEQFR